MRKLAFRLDCTGVSIVERALGLATLARLDDRCHLERAP
jgi:hypothetical protein